MTDLEILGLNDTQEWYEVKDWNDFVLINEELLYVENINKEEIKHIAIYYNVHDLSFPGTGVYKTTDKKLQEVTLDDYLDKNVYNRYKNNKNIVVDKIIKI